MLIGWLVFYVLVLHATVSQAEDPFERPPIQYSRSTPDNAISRFQSRLERGGAELPFDDTRGYLPGLLQALRVPVESQMLVFSKTSLQRHRITSQTPRAIYFNDEVYIGYCHAGDMLEVSAVDSKLGAVFYTLEQTKAANPVLIRQTEKCLLCHSSSQSGDVPSHLVRSVFADASGLPILSEGSHRVDHTTLLEDRWGGWYVTGTHGRQAHLGNLIVRDSRVQRPISNEEGLNLVDLSGRIPVGHYLTPHSDIVALMVLEHQTMVQNLITQAHFATREALDYEAKLNLDLNEPVGNRLESTTRRIASAGDKLIRGLLFANGASLRGPIEGTSGFAESFVTHGPRDRLGRSLRDFDLDNRMFKYPCSYLIYSDAFDALPSEMTAYVTTRLRSILATEPATTQNVSPSDAKDFSHLTITDRRAIREILQDTKPRLLESRP